MGSETTGPATPRERKRAIPPGVVNTSIRLPDETWRLLKASCTAAYCTMNDDMVMRLQRDLRKHPAPQRPRAGSAGNPRRNNTTPD
jgi:hypothetical protein